MPKIASAEVKARLSKARRAMKDAGLDGVVIQDRANTLYLSGFTGTASTILVTRRRASFFTDSRYIERAERDIGTLRVHGPDGPDLAATATKQKLSKVAFEGTLSYSALGGLRKQLRPARLVHRDVVQDVRLHKSPVEQGLLRKAQREAEKVFDRLLGEIGPGWTERQVRDRLLALIAERKLDGPSFQPIVASGPNSSMPHAEFTDRRIRTRDILTIDMGVRRQGYCSDMTRTVFFGKPKPRMRDVYETVLEAQERALADLSAGALAKDVDAQARGYIAERGYGDYFGHGLGHGLGIEVHEAPYLSAKSKVRLEEGMTVTVEPGIYLPGKFGVRIEDSAIVGRNGATNLMRTPKGLTIL